MKKAFLSTILVLALLTLGVGLAHAIWEDTQSTQVTATILPVPDAGTFHFSSGSCADTVVGFGTGLCDCYIYIFNDSPGLLYVDALTVTTDYPHVTITTNDKNLPLAIGPTKQDNVFWGYTTDSECEPGEVTFNVEVTCSGD